jgi:hypothetical protein
VSTAGETPSSPSTLGVVLGIVGIVLGLAGIILGVLNRRSGAAG